MARCTVVYDAMLYSTVVVVQYAIVYREYIVL